MAASDRFEINYNTPNLNSIFVKMLITLPNNGTLTPAHTHIQTFCTEEMRTQIERERANEHTKCEFRCLLFGLVARVDGKMNKCQLPELAGLPFEFVPTTPNSDSQLSTLVENICLSYLRIICEPCGARARAHVCLFALCGGHRRVCEKGNCRDILCQHWFMRHRIHYLLSGCEHERLHKHKPPAEPSATAEDLINK